MKKTKFISNQLNFAEYVKETNETLYNVLNVELPRNENSTWIPNWALIASCMPFVQRGNYVGYAETQDINDYNECFELIKPVLFAPVDNKGNVYPELLYNYKFAIKKNIERRPNNNAEYSGRLLARLNYLLSGELV